MRSEKVVLCVALGVGFFCLLGCFLLLKPALSGVRKMLASVSARVEQTESQSQESINFSNRLLEADPESGVRPLVALSGASKEKVFNLRKQAVAASPFAREDYEPSAAVFGQIVSGKPWIAATMCADPNTHKTSTRGPSEETRFINNPTALVALEFAFVFHSTESWCTHPNYNLLMQKIEYDDFYREVTVTYSKLPFETRRQKTAYSFNGLNARDLGYPYMYVDTGRSTYQMQFLNLPNVSTEVVKLQNFIHVGYSCKANGGCNNGSPRQPMLEFHEDLAAGSQDREIYIKLWKEKPDSPSDPADMIERIIIKGEEPESSAPQAKEIPDTAAQKISHVVSRENFSTPEKLFTGSFDAIRAIKEAEEEYAYKYRNYTSNIADLDLTFTNPHKQFFVNNTSRIYLNNGFYYVLTDKLIAVYFDKASNAAQFYHLDFYFDGTQQCIAKTAGAHKTCEKLGGTNPRPNSRIKTWIIYDLPADFLK